MKWDLDEIVVDNFVCIEILIVSDYRAVDIVKGKGVFTKDRLEAVRAVGGRSIEGRRRGRRTFAPVVAARSRRPAAAAASATA